MIDVSLFAILAVLFFSPISAHGIFCFLDWTFALNFYMSFFEKKILSVVID